MKIVKLLVGVLLGVGIISSSYLANGDVKIVHAVDLGDDLDGDSSDVSNNGIGDLLQNHQSVTNEQLADAQVWTKPITDFFGNVVGIIICLLTGAIFVITMADLCYIAVPPLRSFLYRGGQQAQGGMPQMGGFGGRMGGYGAPMGGISQPQSSTSQWQIISDEALQCAALLNGTQQQNPQMSFMGAQPQQQGISTKSVIFTYFKKRVFFMVLLAICLVTLTSSIFLGTGVNIANWFTNLVELLNSYIPK